MTFIFWNILLVSCNKNVIHYIPQVKDEVLQQRIISFLDEYEKEGFSGSVLVQVGDSVFVEAGYGMSNRSENIENTNATIFDIGSVTKQFTAAAILKLEMNGLIELSDKIVKYIPELNSEKADISVHQLLTHTSGLNESVGNDEEQISKGDFINKVNSVKLKYSPGEKYHYSNVGYSILGILIEKVSNKSYESFLREELFIPAKMMKTGYVIPDWDNETLAVGYRGNKKYGYPIDQNWNEEGPFWHLKANGGILTNVNEMYLWHKALLESDVLDEEAKEMMYSKHTIEFDNTSFYGYGWAIFPTNRGTDLISHNGGNDYFFADVLRFIEEDIVIIIMSNNYNTYAEEMSNQLRRIIFE